MTIIIIPVHNESETIGKTIHDIYEFCGDYFGLREYEIVIVNDGSTDETLEVCKKMKTVEVIDNVFDRGKGSALKTGFVIANTKYNLDDGDDIIFIDGDGQINPNELKVLFNIMKLYNAGAVIGNKRHKYSMTEYTMTRRIISQTYNRIIKFLFDVKFEDTQCGIKIFKKDVLEKALAKVNVKQYAFDLELIIALRGIRCRIADAPVTIRPQMNRGAISINSIIRTFFDTILIWIKMKKRFYSF